MVSPLRRAFAEQLYCWPAIAGLLLGAAVACGDDAPTENRGTGGIGGEHNAVGGDTSSGGNGEETNTGGEAGTAGTGGRTGSGGSADPEEPESNVGPFGVRAKGNLRIGHFVPGEAAGERSQGKFFILESTLSGVAGGRPVMRSTKRRLEVGAIGVIQGN